MNTLFACERRIGSLQIDFSHQLWKKGGLFPAKFYRFADILGCEIITDGSSIYKTQSGSMIGRAAIGAVAFGSFGAILGDLTAQKAQQPFCSELSVNITVNDYSHPVIKLKLITSETRKDSYAYKAAVDKARNIMATLKIMCDQASVSNVYNNSQHHISRHFENNASLSQSSNSRNKAIGFIVALASIIIFISSACYHGIQANTTTSTQEKLSTTHQTITRETTAYPTTNRDYYIVSVNKLNLREKPTTDSKILASLTKDTLLEKLDEPVSNWVHIRTTDGIEGYVYYKYVEESLGNSNVKTDTTDSNSTTTLPTSDEEYGKFLKESVLEITCASMQGPNYVGGMTFDIDVKNKSKKTIKYVSFQILVANAVNDPLYSDLSFDTDPRFWLKMTGPIEPNEIGGKGRVWEDAFYNSTSSKWGIQEIRIDYMDGTTFIIEKNYTKYIAPKK